MGGMDLMHMWTEMGWVAKAIAVILVVMSMISFGVAIERIYTFAQARKQSKLYAPQLAKVVLAGMQEYQFQQESGSNLSREDLVDTVRRAIQRASALTANDLKKGVSSLATIGATAPFVGLLGTVVGIITAFQGIAATGSGGLGAVSAGISEALVETALGLVVAIPAVWFYNYLTGESSTSTSRWITRRPSSWTTSSRRRRRITLPGCRRTAFGRRLKAAPPGPRWQ